MRRKNANLDMAQGVIDRLNEKLGMDITIHSFNGRYQADYNGGRSILSPILTPKELAEWLYACEKGVDLSATKKRHLSFIKTWVDEYRRDKSRFSSEKNLIVAIWCLFNPNQSPPQTDEGAQEKENAIESAVEEVSQ